MANLETAERFADYSSRLIQSAESDSSVLGLVLVGSTAETLRVDEWSDHDFFLVVADGHVLEFAVFEVEELPLAGINSFAGTNWSW